MNVQTAACAAPVDRTLTGAFLLFLGILAITLQDLIVKRLSGVYPVHEILLLRSVFALVTLLALSRFEGGPGALRTKRLSDHFFRSGLILIAFTFFSLSLAVLPFAETVTLFHTAPLFIALLARLFFREAVSWDIAAAVLLGFLGTVMLLRPGGGVFEWASLLPVAAAFCYSLFALRTRVLGRTETGIALSFYPTCLYGLAAAAAGIILGGGVETASDHPGVRFLLRAWSVPTPADFGLLATGGACSAAAFYMICQAYRLGKTAVLAPMEYMGVPVGFLFGFLFLRETPDAGRLPWVGLIVFCGVYVVWRDARRRRYADTVSH